MLAEPQRALAIDPIPLIVGWLSWSYGGWGLNALRSGSVSAASFASDPSDEMRPGIEIDKINQNDTTMRPESVCEDYELSREWMGLSVSNE